MKKVSFLVISLICIAQFLIAQSWELKGITGNGLKTSSSVFRDEVGNTYVVGTFTDTLKIENQVLSSNGNYDIYIAAYNNSASLKWLQKIGGNSADYVYDAVYKNGVIYLGGSFLSDSINLQTTTLYNPDGNGGYTDSYILAMDTSSNFIWGKSFGSQGSFMDQINDLEVTDDALYAAGTFEGAYNAGNGVVAFSSGQTDASFLKFDLTGNTRWGRFGQGAQKDYGVTIAVDNFGAVYCAGTFGNSSGLGNATLFIGSFQLTTVGTSGFSDLFIAKFDTAGVFYYARREGGGNPDVTRKLLVKNDMVTLAGIYYYETVLGRNSYITNGGYEGFVLAFDTALTTQWSQIFTYTQGASASDDELLAIDKDNSGNYLVFVQHTPFKHTLYFVNSIGAILSSDDLVTQNNASFTGSIFVDGSCGSVYVTAGYINTIAASNDTLTGGYGDVFLGIRRDSASILLAPQNITAAVADTICANNSNFVITVDSVAGAQQYSWQITPQFAGTITSSGTNAIVNIDSTYNGVSSIYCIAASGCSVSPASDTILIVVKATPPTPTILVNGLSLTANTFASSYTWYYNGAVIPNETGISIVATANGVYQVVANFDGCQSDFSNSVVVTTVGIKNNFDQQQFYIYPNPTNGIVNFFANEKYRSMNISIMDAIGTCVYKQSFYNNEKVSLSLDLPAGVYLLNIEADNKIATHKVVMK